LYWLPQARSKPQFCHFGGRGKGIFGGNEQILLGSSLRCYAYSKVIVARMVFVRFWGQSTNLGAAA